MSIQTSFTFRFADIEVREPELRVIRSGEPLAIEPKAFRVLIYLLRHAGHLVPKEEILTAVWGDTAVTDNSLTRAIALLRRLLDDDSHTPRYIETVSTAGYRFICPVETCPDVAVVDLPALPPDLTQPDTTAPQAKERHTRRTLWIALAAAAVVLAGVAGFTWYLSQPLPPTQITSYTKITSDGQRKGIAGTDGINLYLNLLANAGLGVVPATGGRMAPLSIDLPTSENPATGSPGIAIQDVSPDGSKLLVASGMDPSSGTSLWIVDAHGGSARFMAKGYRSIWSPDGKTVLYSTLHGDLYIIPSEGGEPRLLLTSLAAPGIPLGVYSLAWSPDGKRIRFVRNERYWEVSIDGKNSHEILPNWHSSNPKYFMGSGHWTPDGNSFLFLAGSSGFSQNLAAGQQIWALDERRTWLHRSNPEPVPLTTGGTIWGGTVISRDGKALYSVGFTLRGELVRYDAKSRELVPYLGGISAEGVSFSKDGRYLVYVTYPEGVMWRANRDGSGLQQLTSPPFHPITPEWSPDGTQILFCEHFPASRRAIYTVSSQGGTPKRLLPDDGGGDVIPNWSPDGKKIVFDQIPAAAQGFGWYQGEKSRILELESGKVTDLPPCPQSCYSPRWSPDGRYILELAIDHHDLMLLDLQTNKWSRLNLNAGNLNFPRWSHDGRFIYFQDVDAPGWFFKSRDPGIYRVSFKGGKTEKVVDLKGFRVTGSFTVGWSDLDPDDTPLLLRDAGTYDAYALALERK
jgi:Tol biopolymer transport system component/DNA-binding winged helix-turn-helix (wHTH) protein